MSIPVRTMTVRTRDLVEAQQIANCLVDHAQWFIFVPTIGENWWDNYYDFVLDESLPASAYAPAIAVEPLDPDERDEEADSDRRAG
jgi:hypothetical protein